MEDLNVSRIIKKRTYDEHFATSSDNTPQESSFQQPAEGSDNKASPQRLSTTAKCPSGDNNSKKPSVEKRLFRTRKTCPKNLHDRLQRAMSQRMYLVQRRDRTDDCGTDQGLSCDFVVAGSTGNIYTVKIDHVPTCTCPDFLKTRDLCKHVFFVLLKCIGIAPDSYLLYQKAFLSEEIRSLMKQMKERRSGGVQVSDSVVAAYTKRAAAGNNDHETTHVQQKSLAADADCPVCFDPLQEGSLVYCRAACGSNFHADCIQRWMVQGSHQDCPNCRQPWIDPKNNSSSPGKRARGQEGYVNLSDITGQSPVRDTSTYYSSARRRFY